MGIYHSRLSLNRAQVINLSSGYSRSGYILGGSNQEDLYRFKLGRHSSLDITLDLLKTDVNLQLFNAKQRLIGASTRRGNASEEILADVKPGTYFLRVHTKKHKFTRYQLELMTDWAESSSPDGDSLPDGNEDSLDRGHWGSNDWSNDNWHGGDWTDAVGGEDGNTENGMDDDWNAPDDPLFAPAANELPDSLILTSPNGGDTIPSGSRYAITWSSDTGSLIKIELLKGDSLLRTIAGTSNSGNYSWSVPMGLTPGSDYRIRLSTVSDAKVADLSDQFFTIK